MTQLRNSNSPYEKDTYTWALTQARFIRSGDLSKMDLENIAEEIEDLAKSQRRALRSQLSRLLTHLLKCEYQEERRTKSWNKSIVDARIKINDIVKESPSLKIDLTKILEDAYCTARKYTTNETGLDIEIFPRDCPWTLKEVLGE